MTMALPPDRAHAAGFHGGAASYGLDMVVMVGRPLRVIRSMRGLSAPVVQRIKWGGAAVFPACQLSE